MVASWFVMRVGGSSVELSEACVRGDFKEEEEPAHPRLCLGALDSLELLELLALECVVDHHQASLPSPPKKTTHVEPIRYLRHPGPAPPPKRFLHKSFPGGKRRALENMHAPSVPSAILSLSQPVNEQFLSVL